MKSKQLEGHLAALITVIIWGTTFISTKILLRSFAPLEILILRFALGFAALLAASPKRMGHMDARQEMTFAAAGLCGICLYYLLENVALTYTTASNVGVIISVAPFFTAMLSRAVHKDEERPHISFFVGFAIAMLGIAWISFGSSGAQINPLGDLLALAAAMVWACYSVLTRKIASFGHSTALTTRRIFFYGLLFMIPASLAMNPEIHLAACFSSAKNVGHLLYLGLGASALCFVTWNSAVKTLGAVKTSVYIYLVPAITVAASAFVLHEPVTFPVLAGTGMMLAGLFLSELRGFSKKRREI